MGNMKKHVLAIAPTTVNAKITEAVQQRRWQLCRGRTLDYSKPQVKELVETARTSREKTTKQPLQVRKFANEYRFR